MAALDFGEVMVGLGIVFECRRNPKGDRVDNSVSKVNVRVNVCWNVVGRELVARSSCRAALVVTNNSTNGVVFVASRLAKLSIAAELLSSPAVAVKNQSTAS